MQLESNNNALNFDLKCIENQRVIFGLFKRSPFANQM